MMTALIFRRLAIAMGGVFFVLIGLTGAIGRRLPADVVAYEAVVIRQRDIKLTHLSRGISLRVTSDPGNDIHPTWSPDGRELAFVSDRERQGQFALYILDTDSGRVRRVLPGESSLQPVWSPDGEWIAYADNGGTSRSGRFLIHLTRPDGSETRLLAPNYPADMLTPAWSPDSTQIVFRTTDTRTASSLQVIDIETGQVTALLDTNGGNYPVWQSPAMLVFSRNRMLYTWMADMSDVVVGRGGIEADIRSDGVVISVQDEGLAYGTLDDTTWTQTTIQGNNPAWRP